MFVLWLRSGVDYVDHADIIPYTPTQHDIRNGFVPYMLVISLCLLLPSVGRDLLGVDLHLTTTDWCLCTIVETPCGIVNQVCLDIFPLSLPRGGLWGSG
jgi:hypothetical protein